MNYSAAIMWSEYLRTRPDLLTGADALTVSAWAFGSGAEMETELAELVVAGTKRATASSLLGLLVEDEPVPRVGSYSVILDGTARARCIIRTTAVSIVPFNEVTPGFAALEGEGDGSLAYWRDGHRRFFRQEHTALGIPFDESIPVVCEEFSLIRPKPYSSQSNH